MRNRGYFTHQGERLTEVAFPLGGIGAGCISLEGRGALRDWEIFGRPNKGTVFENTFAALRWQSEGEDAQIRVLQGPRTKDFLGIKDCYGTGNLYQGEGLPCFDEAVFTGGFPFCEIELKAEDCPLSVQLEAFSPFYPHQDREASMPVASLTYRLENRSSKSVDVLLTFSMKNPVGASHAGAQEEEDQATANFKREGSVAGLQFSNARYGEKDIHAGTFAITTDWDNATYTERWYEGSWFDALQDFWNRLSRGELHEDAPNPGKYRMPATLGLRARIEPGESVSLPILLSWCFPYADRYWDQKFEPEAGIWTRWYATQWPTAWDSAKEFFDRREELEGNSRKFQDALWESDLPDEIVASIGYTASILRTPTCDRLEDGTLWAWEGCNEKSGCCHGSCSHVWNYSLTHAYLFPRLYKTMLGSAFDHGFKCGPEGDRGALNFRIMLPMATGSPLWHAAIDGQLGLVMQLCRTWKVTGDEELRRKYWPAAKRALEFAWVQWDRDRDGLVDGDMHNTYDINFQGPNPLGQFFYLGALYAGAEMAEAEVDAESAEKYRALAAKGETLATEKLWNGEFFEQRLEAYEDNPPKYQHGTGCLSDQVFGSLCARLAGLPEPGGEEMVGKTLDAIMRHNFRDPIGNHANLQRSYVARDEAGLLLCSWPNGGRLDYPFVYSDEVWTGIEYQVATHLAFHGRTDDALKIVKAIRDRHDGKRRNPYNEVECGSHYARALASYGLLLAWPQTGDRLFVDGSGWGTKSVSGERIQLGNAT